MSYDIYIKDAETGKVIELDEPHYFRGGTYAMGGTTELYLNVTYNYSKFYYKTISSEDGIRWLYNKPVNHTFSMLINACRQLRELEKTFEYKVISSASGERITEDSYWAATPKNARVAVENLLHLAIHAPDGVWDGD